MSEQMYKATVRVAPTWIDAIHFNFPLRLYPKIRYPMFGMTYKKELSWVVNAADLAVIQSWIRNNQVDRDKWFVRKL